MLVSQKRLTVVLSFLALLGSIALGAAWLDSVKNVTAYITQRGSIWIHASSINYSPFPIESDRDGWGGPYCRKKVNADDWPLFPMPEIRSVESSIPIYLLILTYLATLLLIWIVLMNRLARRGSLWRRELHPLSGGSGNRSSNERA